MVNARNLSLIPFVLNAALVEGFAGGGAALVKRGSNGKAICSRSIQTFDGITRSKDVRCFMSDMPGDEFDELRRNDPLQFVMKEVKQMDLNAVVNTVAIVLVSLTVLNQLIMVDADIMRGWTATEMAVRIPVDNWFSYSEVLDNSPLSTKAVTSATVYTIGDFIAQRTQGISMSELDRPRMLRSLLAGLIGHGPLSHLWYGWSENIFENVFHWNQWWGIFPKVFVDQTTWGPFWNNTYILLLGIMKLSSPGTIFKEMKQTTIPLIVSGLKLWPLAHCVTYGLVPVENRLLWVDLVEIIWVTILSTSAAGVEDDVTKEEE